MESYQSEINFSRKENHQKKNKRLIVLLTVFFLLIAVLVYFNSSLSKITDIKINGLSLLSENEIYEKANLDLDMQYLFTRAASIKKKLQEIKEIKDVEVKKQFPGKLIINVTEYQAVAILLTEKNNWKPLLENGYIYYNYDRIYLSRPFISKWNNEDKLITLANELSNINPTVLVNISEIKQDPQDTDPNLILMFTRDGYKIHISLDDISEKLNLYPSIINSLKERNKGLGDIYLLDTMRFQEYAKKD